MPKNTRQLAALLALAAGTGACGTEAEIQAAVASVEMAQPALDLPVSNVVTVTASDFRFRAPSTIPAGLTTFRLINQGPEFHHVQLVKIDGGHTMQEFLDRVAAGDLLPAWVEYVGGPNAPVPGGTSEATVNLDPGSYAIVCVIPSRDGVPHLMKGMAVPLTVAGRASDPVLEPRADVRMVLRDYAYDITPSIRAGLRTVRVENVADQPHEVFIVKLAPGKTAQDMLRWIGTGEGTPPGTPVSGTTLLTKGEVNFLTIDFEPGEYALLCFVPDAGDGREHVSHGMVRQITIG